MKKALFALALAAAPLTADLLAQQPELAVTGRVIDERGMPAPPPLPEAR